MNRLCFACDLKDDDVAIDTYKKYHEARSIWSEITASIRESGVLDMQIYLIGNRLFMIMEVEEGFELQKKADLDRTNSKVQEWEALMSTFQQAVPWSTDGQKWAQMECIFKL